MHAAAASEIAQIFYTRPAIGNFAHAVADLCATLTRRTAEKWALLDAADHLATLQSPGTRIVLGYSDQLPGPHPACFIIAIGDGPQAQTADLPALTHPDLCRLLAGVLERAAASDQIHWKTHPAAPTPALIAELLNTAQPEPAPSLPPLAVESDDMERLMHRLTDELTARRAFSIRKAITAASNPASSPIAPPATGPLPNDPQAAAKTPHPHGAESWLWRQFASNPRSPGSLIPSAKSPSTTAHELKAVRAALYAEDFASSGSFNPDGLLAGARRALRNLALGASHRADDDDLHLGERVHQ